eukprot:TRINITY_DN1798_c0_g1_i1.p1 TRINITY_DN1798_c0_g1~~TRINITY_DN1798_c0_g1_i1.p1  ORF type:complete len:247 (-),score=84.18 TRINITY_DN1798_c0_g1_i1:10-750(-)
MCIRDRNMNMPFGMGMGYMDPNMMQLSQQFGMMMMPGFGMGMNMPMYPNQYRQMQQPNQKPQYLHINQNQDPHNESFQFKKKFKRLLNYQVTDNELAQKFEALQKINPEQISYGELNKANFYIVNNITEDDIHKTMKYGLYSSIPENNEILRSIWEKAKQNNNIVYIFFGSQYKNYLNGVAQMTDDLNPGISFKYWSEQTKFLGSCKLEWIYIKSLGAEDLAEINCLLYTSPSPRDKRQSRMPSSA